MTERQSRRRGPKPDRRRALELLASCRDGCTEAIMVAQGVAVEMLADLIRDGADRARVAGSRSIEAKCVIAGSLLAGRTVEEEWQ